MSGNSQSINLIGVCENHNRRWSRAVVVFGHEMSALSLRESAYNPVGCCSERTFFPSLAYHAVSERQRRCNMSSSRK